MSITIKKEEADYKKVFTQNLLKWNEKNDRSMPWKKETNPYFIWLSEIILQQTRVDQGLPYYNRFIKTYPTVFTLAKAPEDEVMKLWEGLGYYSRARNLHATAKYIADELNGVFPSTYKDILALKGVGPYTASAIASFAFGLPYAVLDGNVYRVLSRYFGITTPVDGTIGKKEFSDLATQLLDKSQPAKYNQAIMDFGATHCLPKKPKCGNCILNTECIAFTKNKVGVLPAKSKKIKRTTRYFQYVVLKSEKFVYIRKRVEKDIWRNLYEFPMIESDKALTKEEMINHKLLNLIFEDQSFRFCKISKPYRQQLTHQKIIASFWEIEFIKEINLQNKNYIMIEYDNIQRYAFPKIIDCYLKDKLLYLELF